MSRLAWIWFFVGAGVGALAGWLVLEGVGVAGGAMLGGALGIALAYLTGRARPSARPARADRPPS